MIQRKIILKALPQVLKTIDIPSLGKKLSGKVRDFYVLKDQRVMITTDRQSAFDVVLGHIPFKGAVLNMLAAFWFDKTKHIIANHMISLPDPNVLIAKNCEGIPIEMIVRGYISGVTKTSIWYSYEKGERFIYGQHFPEGLKKNQKLPRPVITPTTHGGGKDGHDERLTRDEIIAKGLVSKKLYEQMEKVSLALFAYGSKWCKKHGLILVDTKYEFGLYNGKLMLMDEIHTPDSSRFWTANTYESQFKKGEEPENFDKEFLRLWYAKKGYRGDGVPPKMSNDLIVALSQRYIAIYEKITEKKFKAFEYPIEQRIKNTIQKQKIDLAKEFTYKDAGIHYDAIDPLKKMAQIAGIQTDKNIAGTGFSILKASKGESAAVVEQKNQYLAFVQEGLGTKNLVADSMLSITGKTYYDTIAQDTVAMIINDLITVGARPIELLAYWAVGNSEWFANTNRMRDLVKGWKKACDMSEVSWVGGETPVLPHIIYPTTIDLGGSASGVIFPKSRLTLGKKLQSGDAIIVFESSGIHSNGLTLARKLATTLPQGYKTKLPSGRMYGESLLDPTIIYAKLVNELLDKKVAIHYMTNITGHGWRKIMRHTKEFTYRITKLPPVPEVLQFIVEQANQSYEESYGNLNMGAGFAIFTAQKDIQKVLKIAQKHTIKAYNVGVVEKGPRQVVIEPLKIVFTGESLNLRT